jgi:dTDP-4-dehydrorhamnose reductase
MDRSSVFVLGHGGMLGHVVSRWLRQAGYGVQTSQLRYGTPGDELLREVAASDCAAVVNCIGTTPERATDASELYAVNALLPQRLAVVLGRGRLLIHASSDAVFDGQHGDQALTEPTTARDAYGLSKRLGELALHAGRVVVLRCSIIGLDPGPARHLLSWFLSQPTRVRGYTNQRWNGITTLQWAKLAEQAVRADPLLLPGLHQPACAPAVSKHELLQIAAQVFSHHVELTREESETSLDRTLRPSLRCPRIQEQLEELRLWSEKDPVS